MERDKVRREQGMNRLPSPNYLEERYKRARAHSYTMKSGLFHFRSSTNPTTGGLYFVRCLGNKPGMWLAKSGGREDLLFNSYS